MSYVNGPLEGVGFLVVVVATVAVGPMAISCCLFSLWIWPLSPVPGAAVDACCLPAILTFSFLLQNWDIDTGPVAYSDTA